MKTNVRVVVIGGGVVGASVLYHLTKLGWKDVQLLERAELTSGSTWHAAGGMHTVNGDPNVAKLQQYTIKLYNEIERISGQSCGMHVTGGVMLAGSRERMDWLKMTQARGRYLGMELELLSAAESWRRSIRCMDPRHFLGGIFDPIEGHVDPYGRHAGVRQGGADSGGAEIVRQTRVMDTRQRADGSWDVITDPRHRARRARRQCRRTVGARSRSHGRPGAAGAGDGAPVPDHRGPARIRRDSRSYCTASTSRARSTCARSAAASCSAPTSAPACRGHRSVTPWDFGQDLLPNDLERIAPSLEVAFQHFPRLAEVGIRKVVNGPFTFAPDGNPLVGPIAGLRNYWVACGVMAGFSQGGGVGLSLANWMVEGDPGADIWAMDVARYGDWATLALHQCQGARELFAPLPDPLSQRGAGGRPAAAHLAGLRAAAGRECGVRRVLRPRARLVVRAQGDASRASR